MEIRTFSTYFVQNKWFSISTSINYNYLLHAKFLNCAFTKFITNRGIHNGSLARGFVDFRKRANSKLAMSRLWFCHCYLLNYWIICSLITTIQNRVLMNSSMCAIVTHCSQLLLFDEIVARYVLICTKLVKINRTIFFRLNFQNMLLKWKFFTNRIYFGENRHTDRKSVV